METRLHKNQGGRTAVFAKHLTLLVEDFSPEEALTPLREQLRSIADDVTSPAVVAVLGSFNAGKSTLINALLGTEELRRDVLPANARVIMLRYGKHPALKAYTSNWRTRDVLYSDLHKIAFEGDDSCAELRNDLAFLVVELPNDRLRNLVLVDTPGLHATNVDHAQSTTNFLDRVDALVWVTRATGAARATEVDFLRAIGHPADLLAVNDIDGIDPDEIPDLDGEIARIRTRFGDTVREAVGVSALRACDAIFGGNSSALKASRFHEFCEALNRVSSSATTRERKIANAVTRLEKSIALLEKDVAALVATSDAELNAERKRFAKTRASHALLAEELHRWDKFRQRGTQRLGKPSENQELLSPKLRQELALIHKRTMALDAEQRVHQSRLTRDKEEEAFLNQRRKEVEASKRKYESKGFFDWVTDRLFGTEKEELERDIDELDRRTKQREADHSKLQRDGEQLRTGASELEKDNRRFVADVIAHLRRRERETTIELRNCRIALRRIRWRMQAEFHLVSASTSFTRRSSALQESVLDILDDAGPEGVRAADSCISSIQRCRDICEDLLFSRGFIGNTKLISGYRRVLAEQLQQISGRIPDYSAVLSTIELTLTWVPKSELWRQSGLLTSEDDSPLASFAEGLSGCLYGADTGACERTGRALAIESPTASAMDEVVSFIQKHGGEIGEGFFSAMLTQAPHLGREVFRRAPRFSRTYQRALLIISSELLATIHVAQSHGAHSNG